MFKSNKLSFLKRKSTASEASTSKSILSENEEALNGNAGPARADDGYSCKTQNNELTFCIPDSHYNFSSANMKLAIVSSCSLCKSCFDSNRKPCIQRCNHLICSKCALLNISRQPQKFTCPVDKKVILPSSRVSQPLSILFNCCPIDHSEDLQTPVESVVASIEQHLCKYAQLLESHSSLVSVQLARKILHLLQSTTCFLETRAEFLRRLTSVFQRLLLEVVQICYDSKQRMYEFRRLVNNKGCTIDDLELTDRVIGALVKLYNAVVHYSDSSFTRDALTEYVSHEIEVVTGGPRPRKKLVERVIQTLYRASCFQLVKMVNGPGKLKLREHLREASELRRQHDMELIKMAHEAKIRLAPENWAYLLCARSEPHAQADMQSLLDKCHTPVTVCELESCLKDNHNKCGRQASGIANLEMYLDDLRFIEQCLEQNSLATPEAIILEELREALDRLSNMRHLFLLRRSRVQEQYHQQVF